MSMKFLNLDLELVLIICKYLPSSSCKNLIFTNKKFNNKLVLNSIKRQFTEIKIHKDGDKEWYFNGFLHREDGPAIEYSDGYKDWFIHGKRHREDGPAIERVDIKEWWLNDERHREDGPAIEWLDGDKYWYINGKPHRENGPAIELANGDKLWYIHGKELTEEEFNDWLIINVVARSDPFA